LTADNPVRSGDLINIFGTGFGPHRISPPAGFGVQEADAFRLTDTMEILLDDRVITPEYAGAATGMPGVDVVRFRVPADLPDTSAPKLAIRINNVTSNSAALPTAQTYATAAKESQP
jgi:uncharacterized protein (TIGR03437 family)